MHGQRTDVSQQRPAVSSENAPRVLHVGHHPQRGGGFNDLFLRVRAREQQHSSEANYVSLVDSVQECLEYARDGLESPVTPVRAFGTGTVTAASLVTAGIRLAGTCPLVKEVRSKAIDVIHANSFRAAIVGAVVAAVTRTPFVLHVHHTSSYRAHPRLGRWLFLIADCVIHVSDHTRRALSSGDKHVVVRSLMDIEELRARPSNPTGLREQFNLGDRPVVALVGQLSPRKGHRKAIAATNQIDADLLIVGTGDDQYREELEQLCRSRGVEQSVHFTGYWKEIADVYDAADVVIVPSQDENLPKVIQEAMAKAVPVVASESGGIPELVIDGETGLLVSPEDDGTELATAINRLLRDKSLAKALATAGHKKLRAEFDQSVVATELEAIYGQLT